MNNAPLAPKCPFTGSEDFETIFKYRKPPKDEVKFPSVTEDAYYREMIRFPASGHFLSIHDIDMSFLYSQEYMDSNYKDLEGIQTHFQKIMSLPAEKSDNRARASRVAAFAMKHFEKPAAELSLLDVGSGLGVFVGAMKEYGFRCCALDPDQRAKAHAIESIGVDAVCGDFMHVEAEKKYDIISFNKVLEHVLDPVAMLARAEAFLNPGGVIYVELPDGEVAARHGKDREEFCIDHWHVFSFVSTAMLADLAGFDVLEQERLQEPSTKYTIRSFLTLAQV